MSVHRRPAAGTSRREFAELEFQVIARERRSSSMIVRVMTMNALAVLGLLSPSYTQVRPALVYLGFISKGCWFVATLGARGCLLLAGLMVRARRRWASAAGSTWAGRWSSACPTTTAATAATTYGETRTHAGRSWTRASAAGTGTASGALLPEHHVLDSCFSCRPAAS